jgi:hypothetical protein
LNIFEIPEGVALVIHIMQFFEAKDYKNTKKKAIFKELNACEYR